MKLLFPLVTSVLTPLLITSPVRAAAGPPSDPAAVMQIRISVVDREAASVPAGSPAAKGFTVLVADSAGAPVSDSAVVFRFPDDGPTGSFADSSHSAIVYTGADGLARITGIKWNDKPGSVPIKILATKGDARAGMLLMEMLTANVPEPSPTTQPAPPPTVKQEQPVAPPLSSSVSTPAPATPGATTAAEKPALPRPADLPPSVAEPPIVSVTNGKTANSSSYHSSHKKWIILAAVVAAAAGAGIAMGSKGKSSTTTSSSGVSVGTPTVSVGQP